MFPLLGERIRVRVRVRGYNKFSFDTLRLAAGLFISSFVSGPSGNLFKAGSYNTLFGVSTIIITTSS